MFLIRRQVLVAACLLLSVVIAAQATAATSIPNPSKFKLRTRIAKLEVRTSGQMRIQRLTDTVSDCFPGQHYIQQNTFTFNSGGWLPVRIKTISAPNQNSVTTSPFSPVGGTAATRGEILDYRETNYCKGEQQKLPPVPGCRSSSGRISVALQELDDSSSDPEQLAGLGGRRLMLAIQRKGGSADPVACLGGGPENLSGHPDAGRATASTSMAPGVGEILPTDLEAIKIFSLRKEKRLKLHITVQGVCSGATIRVSTSGSGSPTLPAPVADGDCTFAGYVDATVRTIQK
jgi:hypothetical protein